MDIYSTNSTAQRYANHQTHFNSLSELSQHVGTFSPIHLFGNFHQHILPSFAIHFVKHKMGTLLTWEQNTGKFPFHSVESDRQRQKDTGTTTGTGTKKKS